MESVVTPMNHGVLFNETYRGKKVLLTGHTGFKGTWLLAWLHRLGADVTGYALAPDADHRLYTDVAGDTMCKSIIADVRDRERIKKEIVALQPDFIFHLAAQPLVRLSYEQPVETFSANIIGTAHVLDALRDVKKKCTVVIVTTDKVYENQETGRYYTETDPLGGYDPYSASKAACEIVVSSYRNSFFNPTSFQQHNKAVASARAGNVIGGGDWARDRIVPDLVRAFTKNQKALIRNPAAIRPWQHVLEPIAGYLLLGAMLDNDPVKFGTSWNFGPLPSDVLTVRELVECALKYWENGEVEFASSPVGPHEAGVLKLDISKAENILGWRPKYNAAEAIRLTIEWYKGVIANKEDAGKLIGQQIKEYAG